MAKDPTYWIADPDIEDKLLQDRGISAAARWRFFQGLFVILSFAIYFASRGTIEGNISNFYNLIWVNYADSIWPLLLPTILIQESANITERLLVDITLQWFVANMLFAFLTIVALFSRWQEREEVAELYRDTGSGGKKAYLFMMFYRGITLLLTLGAAILINAGLSYMGLLSLSDPLRTAIFLFGTITGVAANWMAIRLFIQEMLGYKLSRPNTPLSMRLGQDIDKNANRGFASDSALKDSKQAADRAADNANNIFRKK